MKRIILLCTFFILSLTLVHAEGWLYSLDQAKTLAKLNNKLILIDFYADWCGPCKAMDFETWAIPEVKEQMKKIIPVKINIDVNRALATNYGIKAIPAVFIIDANGNILHNEKGYRSDNQMVNLLSGFPEQLAEITNPLQAVDENPKTADPLCQLAEAYQTVAKRSSGKAKSIIIKASNMNFSKAQKLYKKEKNAVAIERIELLKNYNQLLAERTKAVLKMLEKKGIENVDESNKALACFLATKTYWTLKNKDEATKYHEMLKACDDCKTYLQELAVLNPEWD